MMIGIALLVLAAGAFLLYWPIRKFPLIFTEHTIALSVRRRAGVPWPARIWIWLRKRKYWRLRPVTWITYDFDGRFWGLADPSRWRITNIVLHAIASDLVLLLFLAIHFEIAGAIVAGTLYLVAPLNSSAVCTLTARASMLSAVFSLAAMVLFFHGWWFISIPLGYAAFLAKEDAFVLPLAIGALWWVKS